MSMEAQSLHANTNQVLSRVARKQNKVSFAGIVQGELMKVMWLRSTWIMFALVISGTALITLLNIDYKNVHQLLTSDPVQYAFSYELGQNLLVFRVLSGFFALVVTAFSFGLEYQQGTIRIILGRGVGRIKFLLGKIAALFIIAILVQVIGVVLNGTLMLAVIASCTGSLAAAGVILSHCMGSFALYFLYLIFNMWISILLAMVVAVLGHSLAFGLSIALIWFPFDNISVLFSGSLLNRFFPSDFAAKAGNALLGPDLNALPTIWVSAKLGVQAFVPYVSIGEWTVVVILAYAFVFVVGGLSLIRYRDVQQ